MRNKRRIYRILRKSNKIIRMLQFTLLRDRHKEVGYNMYGYQVTALNNYRKIIQLAHEELVAALKM